MATRSGAGPGGYNRISEHRVFDGQPSLEYCTGGWLGVGDVDGDRVVVLEPDGVVLKRWTPD